MISGRLRKRAVFLALRVLLIQNRDQNRSREETLVVLHRTCLVAVWVLAGFAVFHPPVAEGQQLAAETKVDFTQWLQKKSYERFDYSDKGKLKNHQLIQFGELAPRESGCELPLRVISFTGADRSNIKGDTELSLFVECSNPHLIANILKFVGDSDRQHLEARVMGDELAYPEMPREGLSLPDLHYTGKVKRGVLAVLGAKVTVLVSQRRVRIPRSWSSEELESGTYELHGEIDVKMSMMGISVKSTGFSSRMVIDPISGPVEELLEHDGGGRTVVCLVADPAPSPQEG